MKSGPNGSISLSLSGCAGLFLTYYCGTGRGSCTRRARDGGVGRDGGGRGGRGRGSCSHIPGGRGRCDRTRAVNVDLHLLSTTEGDGMRDGVAARMRIRLPLVRWRERESEGRENALLWMGDGRVMEVRQ